MTDTESRVFWDDIWGNEDAVSYWRNMSSEVVAMAELESSNIRPNVLDIGCGAGRNAIAFALKGFKVTACVRVNTVLTSVTKDYFPAETFNIVTAINVLYHARQEDFELALRNILRWMKNDAIFYFTCPSIEDSRYYSATEIAPNTYQLESGHIHYCLSFEMLTRLLAGNQILTLHRCEHYHQLNNEWKVSSRWRVLLKKL